MRSLKLFDHSAEKPFLCVCMGEPCSIIRVENVLNRSDTHDNTVVCGSVRNEFYPVNFWGAQVLSTPRRFSRSYQNIIGMYHCTQETRIGSSVIFLVVVQYNLIKDIWAFTTPDGFHEPVIIKFSVRTVAFECTLARDMVCDNSSFIGRYWLLVWCEITLDV